MAVQSSVAERWKKVTGCNLVEGYGMTEASPVVSLNPLDGSGRLGTIGLPVPSTDVRIVDDNGRICNFGESGEIQVKGPQVMKGYFNKPEVTANTIKNGWLCTGDIGIMEEDGYFKIVDRKKDMIDSGGIKIYPRDVEEVAIRHPAVREVAVFGVAHEKWGETPVAAVVLHANAPVSADASDVLSSTGGARRPAQFSQSADCRLSCTASSAACAITPLVGATTSHPGSRAATSMGSRLPANCAPIRSNSWLAGGQAAPDHRRCELSASTTSRGGDTPPCSHARRGGSSAIRTTMAAGMPAMHAGKAA